MATIKKLSQEVINRIAAGEVIQRPLSAIKELIENCLDANSSMISIMCIDGGFSSIEISDDGKGIDKIDFPLLCERFATSKIEDFTDLMTINSFGFRGEALSSISFVSHLTIKSKTEENSLGFQASFRDGKMLEESIDSIPLNKGTIISVENLFYNLGIRKTSFSFKEEFKEVLKMIYKFAIHHCFVKFKLYSSLKNIEFSSCNLLSKGTDARLELISNIFKINEKKLVSIEQNLQTYSVKIESIISEVGSIKKNRDLFIFINDRLVECDQIKKTIDLIYKSFWVSIHEDEGGYFCYISLKMRSENIDVNVDPRKKLVKFLFAFEICEQITQIYESKLKEKCSIRVYQTVSLPRNSLDIERSMEKNKTNDKIIKNEKAPNKSYVRVDPKSQKLTSFMNINQKSHQNIINNNKEINELPNEVNSLMSSYNNLVKNPQKDDEIIFKLLSIKKESSHEISTLFFHNLTYVGCLNSNFIIAQKDQSLLLINSIPICLEIFTHVAFIKLKKYEEYKLPERINLILLMEKNNNFNNSIKLDTENFQKEKQILEEYFSIRFENEFLISFPKIYLFLSPKTEEIENFLYIYFNNIIKIENWILKLKRICEEIAAVYSWSLENQSIFDDSQKNYDEYFSLTLFPFMKKCCFFEKTNYEDYSYNLLNLEDAYKIFERC